ncbi:MAG: PHP domain-containing protein [Chloroflexi bacterium]|nr:PHP domain-containing protein [Chloroflexota bacterium]
MPAKRDPSRGAAEMIVDLHLHTTASDGVLAPSQLVRSAIEAGLEIIAITDHDSTEGLGEAFQTARAYPRLALIPGIELGTDIPEGEAHILGYFVDYRDIELQRTLARFRDDRIARARAMLERLARLGMPVEWARVTAIAGEAALGRPHVAHAMVEKGYVATVREAFDRFLGYGRPAYVEREKFAPPEAISLIQRVHGLAVLAHPMFVPHLDRLLPALAEAGLEGMETYYAFASPAVRRSLLKKCQRHGLFPTGGSDYHGPGLAEECTIGGAGVPREVGEALLARAPEWVRSARP